MKKKLAWLLAMCMTLQLTAVNVYAEEGVLRTPDTAAGTIADTIGKDAGSGEQTGTDLADGQEGTDPADGSLEDQSGNEQEEGKDPGVDQEEKDAANEKDTAAAASEDQDSGQKQGNLSVELTCNLPVTDVQTRIGQISAVLLKDGTEAVRKDFTAKDGSTTKGTVDLNGIEEGTYLLQINGGGFVYGQEIEIQAMNQQIRLVDMTAVIEGAAHPGTYGYGDVNGDGAVDDIDRSLLLDAVSEASSDLMYDLNGDGAVDLADIQCFTYSYGTESTEATVTRTALIDETKVEAKPQPNKPGLTQSHG